MTETITLRYFATVHGRLMHRYACFTIPSNASVLAAIQEIEKQIKYSALDILLWKPREFLPKSEHQRLRSLLRQHGGDLSKFCDEVSDRDAYVADIFGRATADKMTTLVAEVPKPVPESVAMNAQPRLEVASPRDTLAKLKEGFYKMQQSGSSGTPSQNCRPPDYYRYQDGPTPILDGRYANHPNTIALPVEDFHFVFACFVAQHKDERLQPPEEFVRKCCQYMDATSKIGTDEKRRESDTRQLLSNLLSATFTQLVNEDRTSANHTMVYSRDKAPLGLAALAIVEEKTELGTGGDGSVQGSFSYTQHWLDSGQRSLLHACFCPSFVFTVAGPYINICGAIITSSVIVHRLTDYIWLAHSRLNDDANARRIARVFYALGLALVRLRSYYASLEQPMDRNVRYFPLATAYKVGEQTIKFKYITYLKEVAEACVIYRAVECEGAQRQIVVKFVERYGEAAHKLLASHGLAPQLLYCGDIWLDEPARSGCGDRKMVVMEYVDGISAHAMLHHREGRALPGGVHSAIKRAVELLHDENMVHGDIRLGNVIIEGGIDVDDGDMENRVKIVDFDWAGVEGTVRYPLHLSETISWPAGVADDALILAEHDDEMVRRLAWT